MAKDNIYSEKLNFVENFLKYFLMEIDSDIKDCTYFVDGRSEEFVSVHYQSGHKLKICVSADSFLGIAQDVLRVID